MLDKNIKMTQILSKIAMNIQHQRIELKSFKIDATSEVLYYNMKDLFEYKPEFFYGCTSKKRKIIEKKKIPASHYIYATFAKTKEWNLCDENCKKAQLLFTKEWVDAYFFTASFPAITKHAPQIDNTFDDFITTIPAYKAVEEVIYNNNISISEEEHEPISAANVLSSIPEELTERNEEVIIENVENAPSILELEEEEKFKDINGAILDIEVRGEKDRNNIFFKATDIMKAFDMPNLDIVLRDKTSNYEKGLHYICFNRISRQMNHLSKNEDANKKHKKSLYLTYKGLLRVLFNSRTGNAEHFQDWAEDKLFTIQMGLSDKKEVLAAAVLNTKVENIRAVFSKYSQGFSCIYLLSLGKVERLREDFGIATDIDNSLTVYKYGFTNDIKRRLGEHNRDYGKNSRVNIDLELFNYIDPKYTSEAEGDIRDMFDSFGKSLEINGRNELVALNPKEFDRIKKEYTRTGREFAGTTLELQEEVSKLKMEIVQLNLTHELELLREKSEKDKYKTHAEHVEYISSLKEANYALKDAYNAQIQMLLDKMKE